MVLQDRDSIDRAADVEENLLKEIYFSK